MAVTRFRIIAILAALLATSPLTQAQGPLTADGNSAILFDKCSDFYRDISEAVDSARETICFQYYSVGTDSVSTAILNKLQEKASQGVKVYAIIDNYGSHHRTFPMDDSALAGYRSAGLDIAFFNARKIASPLPRNHRKLTVIDGRTAFVGGMNFNDHNVHAGEKYGEVYDYTLRLEGPVAAILQKTFEDSWNRWSDHPEISLPEPFGIETKGNLTVTVHPTEGLVTRPTVRQNYMRLIESADSSIVMTNAYLLPSRPILNAIKGAAARGVKVDITVGGKTDLSKTLQKRLHHILDELKQCPGITLNIVEGSFFHAKAICIDSHLLHLGSANLDYLSRTTNFELCVEIDDNNLASLFEDTLIF